MAKNNLNMRDVMSQTVLGVTIRVEHMREMKFRAALGTKLILLAAWVMGCGIEFEPFDDLSIPPVHFNSKCELIKDE